MFPFT